MSSISSDKSSMLMQSSSHLMKNCFQYLNLKEEGYCLQVNKRFNKELTEVDMTLKRIMKKIENENPSVLSQEEKNHLKLQFNERFHRILHPSLKEVSEQAEIPKEFKEFKKLEKECNLTLSVYRKAFNENISGEDAYIRGYQKNNSDFFDAFIQAKINRREQFLRTFGIWNQPGVRGMWRRMTTRAPNPPNEIYEEELLAIDPSLRENAAFIESAIKKNFLALLSQINFQTMDEERFMEITSFFINRNISEGVSQYLDITTTALMQELFPLNPPHYPPHLLDSPKFLIPLEALLKRRFNNPQEALAFMKRHRENILGKLEEGKKEHFKNFLLSLEKLVEQMLALENAMQNEQE